MPLREAPMIRWLGLALLFCLLFIIFVVVIAACAVPLLCA